MTDDYEYDVAFSFNALDEGVASQLNDLLSDRMRTFIYSERQREIAGTDGQQAFSEVYGKTSRLVVVLFRPEWGETPWTRVERDAIKNRSLDEGWDFTTFIPTVAKPQMPPWLPKTRLYVGLERWGIESAAARNCPAWPRPRRWRGRRAARRVAGAGPEYFDLDQYCLLSKCIG